MNNKKSRTYGTPDRSIRERSGKRPNQPLVACHVISSHGLFPLLSRPLSATLPGPLSTASFGFKQYLPRLASFDIKQCLPHLASFNVKQYLPHLTSNSICLFWPHLMPNSICLIWPHFMSNSICLI